MRITGFPVFCADKEKYHSLKGSISFVQITNPVQEKYLLNIAWGTTFVLVLNNYRIKEWSTAYPL